MNLSMFLLTISVGRICSVQSDFELSAIKKNLMIMSDIKEGFLDRFMTYGFSSVCVLYPERLQSRKKLVFV